MTYKSRSRKWSPFRLPGLRRKAVSKTDYSRPTGESGRFSLKVATYNIHSCIDNYRVVNMEKIARVIFDLGPDVVALQEVDANKPRTAGVNQAKWLAQRLGMKYFFYPVVETGIEKYGLAILADIPMEKVMFGKLPTVQSKKPREIRGAMWVRLKTPGGPVNLINTHLGLLARERRLQIASLLGNKWLGSLDENEPLVLCGDLNAGRRSHVYRQLHSILQDVQMAKLNKGAIKSTFFSFYPLLRLDHIFISKHFSALQVKVPGSLLARSASDHLPVFAELSVF